MQPTLQALLGLQQIDRQLYSVESELERLPAELAKREEVLAGLGRRAEQLAAQVEELRRDAKEVEDYTVGMRQRQKKLETESTKQKIDAAMLASYEHEIRSLKRGISEAEDEAIRKMSAGETLDNERQETEKRLEAEQTVFEELRANVEKEVGEADGRRNELLVEREAASSDDVSPEALELYRRLLSTREGEALAELADGHCQTCFVQIPRNLGVRLVRGEIVQCPTCTRILYKTF
jgi:predicted  nucleic acid-binding Zn-ribbon protein